MRSSGILDLNESFIEQSLDFYNHTSLKPIQFRSTSLLSIKQKTFLFISQIREIQSKY